MLDGIVVACKKQKVHVTEDIIDAWRYGTDDHRNGICKFLQYVNEVDKQAQRATLSDVKICVVRSKAK